VEERLHVVLTAAMTGGGDQYQVLTALPSGEDRSMLLIEHTGHCVTVGDSPTCTVSVMP
jgi:hypothetical protein